MTKYTMKGTVLRADIGAGLVAVPGCETIGFPEEVVAEIEASDHDSANKEYLTDLADIEQSEVAMRWDPAEATHAYFEANKGAEVDFSITVKGAAAPTTNDVYSFTAKILSFKKAPHAHQGGVMMATLVLRANAKPVVTDSV